MSAGVPRAAGGAAQRWAWHLQRTAATSRRAALVAGAAAAVELAAAAALASGELAERLPGLPLRWVALVLAGLAMAALAAAALHLLFARTWGRLAAAPDRPAAEDAAFALRALWTWTGTGAAALALGLAAALALSPRWLPAAGAQMTAEVPVTSETLGLRPVAGGEPVWTVPGPLPPLPAVARPAEVLPAREVPDSALSAPPRGRFLLLEDVPRACAVEGPALCLLNQGGSAVPGLGVEGPAGVGPVVRRLGRGVQPEIRGLPHHQRSRIVLWSSGWGIEIAPPDGQPLVPGLYERASSFERDRARPFLEVHAPGESCGGASARFRIHDVELDVDGRPRRLVADFEALCSNWIVGRVRLGG